MTALARKSRRSSRFYDNKIEGALTGDTVQALSFLEQMEAAEAPFKHQARFRILVKSKYGHGNYSIKTVKKMLLNGHTDIEAYAFVNPMELYKRYENGNTRYAYRPYVKRNFVLDIDKCKFDSVESLLHLFETKGLPAPNVSVTTSLASYHCVILGSDGQWDTYEARALFCCRLFDIEIDKTFEPERLSFELRRRGVDVNYLTQDLGMHKIRIPGTLNKNHSEVFICQGRINVDDDGSAQKYITKNKIDKLIERTKTVYRWDSIIEDLVKLFAKTVGKKWSRKWAEVFAENMTFLKRGDYYITQTKIAKRFGVTQQLISKHLGKMCKAHLIESDGRFVPFGPIGTTRSKVYRIGQTMTDSIFAGENKITVWNLSRIYDQDGQTNRLSMRDIKILIAKNVDRDDIKRIILAKSYARPVHKRLTSRDIEYKVNYFANKIEYKPVGPPKIDVEDLMKRIDEQND